MIFFELSGLGLLADEIEEASPQESRAHRHVPLGDSKLWRLLKPASVCIRPGSSRGALDRAAGQFDPDRISIHHQDRSGADREPSAGAARRKDISVKVITLIRSVADGGFGKIMRNL
jgi:hypothetical protein